MSLLEVEGLRVGYGFPVLMGISFAVDEGQTAVMFGLNGAGKTTTVAAIAGLSSVIASSSRMRFAPSAASSAFRKRSSTGIRSRAPASRSESPEK